MDLFAGYYPGHILRTKRCKENTTDKTGYKNNNKENESRYMV